ncbi:MAG: OsmC/Ohr family protein [Ignavibacteriae bacterium]|nr:MAG: OsmC/Ohr family protein [Ignavibacteriota bacterium]
MATKKAVVQNIKGITFAGKADSNHWVIMDGPEEFGGSNAGTRPKELVLIALGGCTGSDVASILRKKRVNFKNFYINIEAEVAEEHPQVYTKINLEYVLEGKSISPSDVERAIELSKTKYCSVSFMLKNSVEITHTYKIIEVD